MIDTAMTNQFQQPQLSSIQKKEINNNSTTSNNVIYTKRGAPELINTKDEIIPKNRISVAGAATINSSRPSSSDNYIVKTENRSSNSAGSVSTINKNVNIIGNGVTMSSPLLNESVLDIIPVAKNRIILKPKDGE